MFFLEKMKKHMARSNFFKNQIVKIRQILDKNYSTFFVTLKPDIPVSPIAWIEK
jgi:hypothetical protein